MEEADKQRDWSYMVEDILSCILSRLAMGDYLSFKSVCKSWKSVALLPFSLTPVLLDHASPHDRDSYQDPHIMYLNKKTRLFHFHDPTRNANYSLNIPQLLNDGTGQVELYYANCGWLLLGRGEVSYFFFNPSTKVTIHLPDTRPGMIFSSMCFSGLPNSPNCQIVAISSFFEYTILIGMLKLGDRVWSVYYDVGNEVDFLAANCSPVVRNGVVYVLGESGNLGKLCIKPRKGVEEFSWNVVGKSHRTQFMKFRDRFLLESDGNLICVATLDNGQVRVLKLDSKMVWQKVENLKGKTFYVSYRTSLSLKTSTHGTGNKIYFPRFYDGRGLFYCLATKKWHNFPQSFLSEDYYNTRGIFQCVWTQLPNISSTQNM